MNEWIKLADRKPEPGQLVVINFTANWTRLRLCYFDTIETWCARTGLEWEDDFRDDIMPCFTEADDPEDWWDADVVACWTVIAPPSSQQPRGMKQTEIRPCVVCKKGVAHDNQIAFFRVRVEHMVLDVRAIQRQVGLEMMLSGNAALAFHMGPQNDIAKCASDSGGLVCQECWLTTPAGSIWESLQQPGERNG